MKRGDCGYVRLDDEVARTRPCRSDLAAFQSQVAKPLGKTVEVQHTAFIDCGVRKARKRIRRYLVTARIQADRGAFSYLQINEQRSVLLKFHQPIRDNKRVKRK